MNPYGIAIVGQSAGSLVAGNYLVSNFNAKSNDQGTGTTVFQISPAGKLSVFAQFTLSAGGKLNQPLGLEVAPNGDIITTNAGDGNMVETTPAGHQVATLAGDAKSGAGSLFGLAVTPNGKGLIYVDDGLNTLRLLH